MSAPGPREYAARRGVTAWRVSRPFRAVAQWCGGEVVTGSHGRFMYILLTSADGRTSRAYEGDYIEQLDSQVFGQGFVVRRRTEFEANYEEAGK